MIDRPAWKLALKRGTKATEFYACCAEVGCDVWGLLCSMIDPEEEVPFPMAAGAVCRPGTSVCAHAVELPAAKYLRFQGEPCPEDERDPTICRVRAAMERAWAFNGMTTARAHRRPGIHRVPKNI